MRRRLFALVLSSLVATSAVGCTVGPSATPSGSPSTSTSTGSAEPTRVPAERTPSPAPSTVSGPGADRIEDLDVLVRELRRIHPEPWSADGEDAFMARVAAVKATAADLTDVGFLLAVMDLTGHRPQDGHTGTFPMAQTNDLISAWPIWLWQFPDGYHIVAARSPYEDLIGARVVAIGDTDPADLALAVEPFVPADNPSSLRANHTIWMTIPEILAELGVSGVRGDDPDLAALTLEMPDGTERRLTPEPLAMPAYWAWITGAYGTAYPSGLPPDADGPLVARHRENAFWTADLPDGSLYLAYNNVVRTAANGTTIAEMAAAVDVAASEARPVVIDLRNNPGGDNTTYSPLRLAAPAYASQHPDRIALLTGRSTFSAAGNFVTVLETGPEGDDIVLVGEPPGGGLNVWGNAGVTTLPNSGIVVIIASRAEVRAPGDPRTMLPVDVAAEITFDAWLAGRDLVLEAALDAIAAAPRP